MKNEDRIVELLSESLKRQDTMVEEIKEMKGGINEMKDGLNDMRSDINQVTSAVNALADIMKAWTEKTKGIDELKDRVTRLEKHSGL